MASSPAHAAGVGSRIPFGQLYGGLAKTAEQRVPQFPVCVLEHSPRVLVDAVDRVGKLVA